MFKNKVGALFAAAALAAGLGVAGAGAASAAPVTLDQQSWYLGASGLQGAIDAKRTNGATFQIPGNGSPVTWTEGSGSQFQSIKAGSGYCVNEKTYVKTDTSATANGGKGNLYADRNFGKNFSTGQGYTSQYWNTNSYVYLTGHPNSKEIVTSVYGIFAC